MKAQASLEFMIAMAAMAAAVAAMVSVQNSMAEGFADSAQKLEMQAKTDLAAAQCNRLVLDRGFGGFDTAATFNGGAALGAHFSGAMGCAKG